MECFTVCNDEASQGIYIFFNPYPHIPVGKEGRGRQLQRFPVASRFANLLAEEENADADALLVKRASVLKTREKGTLLLVEERDSADKRALALIGIEGGYRGSTEWTAATSQEIACPERGRCLWLSRCPTCGVYGVKTEDGYTVHPDEGTIVKYDPFPSPDVVVLAEGYGAEGAAGLAGGPHWIRLVIMEPGACIRIRRRGRLYGGPAEIYVYWNGSEMRVGKPDEVFPPSCETPEGEVI